jgi:hypothetical protein
MNETPGNQAPAFPNLAGQPDSAATGFGRLIPGSPFGYGYQWWALAPVVAVIQSAWHRHDDDDVAIETFALLRAAVLALRPYAAGQGSARSDGV